MKITTKYSAGDSVTAICHENARQIIKCQCCENTGSVTISGEQFECPKCDGKAKHPVWRGRRWFIHVADSPVGQVRVEFTAARKAQSWDDEGDKPELMEIQYMLEATGIGGGSLWSEENVFPSREEAQAECDRRNADNKPDEA